MVITEEELRQAWQNGRGQISPFPPGTRFTPAALDFLKVCQPKTVSACAPSPSPVPPAVAGDRRELKAPEGQRQIFTAAELPELLAGGAAVLVVHPSVTVTHAAQDLLRKAGVRVVPYVEPSARTASPALPSPKDSKQEELFQKVRSAVLARLGRPVDPAVLDAVLRKVLASL